MVQTDPALKDIFFYWKTQNIYYGSLRMANSALVLLSLRDKSSPLCPDQLPIL